MIIKVHFNQERNREPELHSMASVPVPSSVFKIVIADKKYSVSKVEMLTSTNEDYVAEIWVNTTN